MNAHDQKGVHTSSLCIPVCAKRAGEETGGCNEWGDVKGVATPVGREAACAKGGWVNGEAAEMVGAGSPCCTPCLCGKDGGAQTGGCTQKGARE